MSKKDIKEKLRKVIQREASACMGREGSALSTARADLKRRYLGHGYENDEERQGRGWSVYVDRTLMEVVEWAKPGLMRVFCGDEIIRFDPKTPQQEQAADDATLYVNQVIFGRNMFDIVHDVLSDGLYQRVGWCLAHCPKREEVKVRKFSGLAQAEALAMVSAAEKEGAGVDVQAVETPQGVFYDLTLRRKVQAQEICLDPVPSEQVIISADARDVESARFVAHWSIKTASDLRKEGYSQQVIDELPAMDGADDMPETEVGRRLNDEGAEGTDAHSGALREFKVYEAWFDFDHNGDGIAEKVKVVYCGEAERCVVLEWEEWPLYRAPLFAACSVPMPHQVVGLSLADLVSDLQDLRTEVTRQYLDNLALANQGELVVNEGTGMGSVEYDSLLARGVGSVHRIKGDASITPLPVATSLAEALQGLEMTKDIIERRTGVSSRTQSLKADALQNTATGAAIMEEAVNQRLELIARVYAEMFFKPLGRYVLHLVHQFHDKQIQLRLKGRFMEFDPRKWDPDMDISVAVGLGTGNRQKLIGSYGQILQIQQAFMTQLGPNSPVKLSNIIYTCHKLAEAAGLEAPERFFGTEEEARRIEQIMASQPPQPSPEQQKIQLEQQKAQAKMQTDRMKVQTEAERKAFETQAKIALEKQKAAGQLAMRQHEMALEAQLDSQLLAAGERNPGLVNVRRG